MHSEVHGSKRRQVRLLLLFFHIIRMKIKSFEYSKNHGVTLASSHSTFDEVADTMAS